MRPAAGCRWRPVRGRRWMRSRRRSTSGLPRSRGKICGDVCHRRLVAMGYVGSERTTRRAVAEAKRRWRAEHGRRTRPWVVEPGLWMQWDYGDGPVVAGRSTVLFCAWLAWSRFGVVLALWDKTTPSAVMALDRALRAFGGAATYALTDNERTVSVDHVRGAQPDDRVGRSSLRPDGRHVRAGRSAEQGRQRGDGPDREGRSGPSTTCATATSRSRRSSGHAWSSVSASIPVSIESPGARRW
jgi:hypothetical protein